MRHFKFLICLSVVLPLLCSCSLIDDDMADCANNSTIDIRLHEYGNVDSLLAGQVPEREQALSASLSDYYNRLLHPSSHSVWLEFYDAATGELCSTVTCNMTATEDRFTQQLPSSDIRCLALSPELHDGNGLMGRIVTGGGQPFYSGRLNMPSRQDSYTVDIYPVDAQVALIASTDPSISHVEVSVEGCASGFNISDSTYRYDNNGSTALPLQQNVVPSPRQAYAGSVIPSLIATKPWEVIVLATTATGSVTRTVLSVQAPLRQGDIRVLLTTIGANGAAQTTATGVGASVTLDWKKGNTYNPNI